MSDELRQKIRMAQVHAGERAVIEHLRGMGLADGALVDGPQETPRFVPDPAIDNSYTGQIATLRKERDELREALRRLYRGYVVTLENGRDRIITLGGDCDPVDRMEREDPLLHDMRALLSRIDGGGT
jgi:hypothetical protein